MSMRALVERLSTPPSSTASLPEWLPEWLSEGGRGRAGSAESAGSACGRGSAEALAARRLWQLPFLDVAEEVLLGPLPARQHVVGDLGDLGMPLSVVGARLVQVGHAFAGSWWYVSTTPSAPRRSCVLLKPLAPRGTGCGSATARYPAACACSRGGYGRYG
jgi:hypothetical protein